LLGAFYALIERAIDVAMANERWQPTGAVFRCRDNLLPPTAYSLVLPDVEEGTDGTVMVAALICGFPPISRNGGISKAGEVAVTLP
jgi:hypothetical protein